jgi:hypothetical protein
MYFFSWKKEKKSKKVKNLLVIFNTKNKIFNHNYIISFYEKINFMINP